jgi:hypothetical protein
LENGTPEQQEEAKKLKLEIEAEKKKLKEESANKLKKLMAE